MKLLEIIKKIEEERDSEIKWLSSQLNKQKMVSCGCPDCDDDSNMSSSDCYNIDFWFYTRQKEKAIYFYKNALLFVEFDLIDEINENLKKEIDIKEFDLSFSKMSNSIYIEFVDHDDDEQTVRISDHNRKSFENTCGGFSDHYYFLQKIF